MNALGRSLSGIAVAALLAFAATAHAGCGTSFCPVSTDFDVRGAWTEPGGRFELRYEYIDQDQPRRGSHKVGVGEVPLEHDELYTINRNWFATLDYNFSREWGVSLGVPLVDRSHGHVHNHEDGEQELETWNFTRLGDIRVVGRYTFPFGPERAFDWGLNLGLKLPTGSTDVRNAEGVPAERSLQPGTGTTDVILGAFLNGGFAGGGDTWFAQASFSYATGEHDNYRPGNRFILSGGWRHPFSDAWAGLLQLNLVTKGRDSGLQAEPEDSGGTFVFLNPGVSVAATRDVQVFGYVQLPLYQYVNGVQLTASWAGVLGVATRF